MLERQEKKNIGVRKGEMQRILNLLEEKENKLQMKYADLKS